MEMQPVACGLAARPEDYVWSSYRHHIGISPSPVIRDHAVYWNLGNTPFAREMAYKAFFEQFNVEDRKLDEILKKGWPLGSDAFIKRLENVTKRQFRMGKRGRPAKVTGKRKFSIGKNRREFLFFCLVFTMSLLLF